MSLYQKLYETFDLLWKNIWYYTKSMEVFKQLYLLNFDLPWKIMVLYRKLWNFDLLTMAKTMVLWKKNYNSTIINYSKLYFCQGWLTDVSKTVYPPQLVSWGTFKYVLWNISCCPYEYNHVYCWLLQGFTCNLHIMPALNWTSET